MRDMGILSRVVPLLQHSNVKLLTRAVGVSRRVPPAAPACSFMLLAAQVVHNMSSDSSSIASIRHEQALPMLINLLKVRCLSHGHSVLVSSQSVTDHQAPQLAICGSAAGTLQNMSREHLSCDIIRCSFSSCCICDFDFVPAAGIAFDESCSQSSPASDPLSAPHQVQRHRASRRPPLRQRHRQPSDCRACRAYPACSHASGVRQWCSLELHRPVAFPGI